MMQYIHRFPWRWCSTFPAVLDLPYCQSFARFFCSMVWNPCKQAVFLPYCQSLARFFCNVVNIHRHRPIARFICNDSCFCAIWPYFDYRYRPNGEFLCNDRSDEDSPAHFQTKSSTHILNGTFHLSCRAQSGRLSEEFTSHFLLPKSSCRLSCDEGTDRRCKHVYQFLLFTSLNRNFAELLENLLELKRSHIPAVVYDRTACSIKTSPVIARDDSEKSLYYVLLTGLLVYESLRICVV